MTSTSTSTLRRIGATLTAAVAALTLLAGCAAAGETASSSAATAASTITVTDAWVMAASAGNMSAAFGTINNSGSSDVTLTAASTPASTTVQLHETVDGVMKEKAGGFVIPAGGSFELAPGANHIMLMELPSDLVAGDQVTVTLTFSDNSTTTFTATVKDSEAYESSDSMGGMDMGSASASASTDMK